MATIAHCDTHTVLWLYAGDTKRLSKKAITTIETCDLMISPMVRLEMQFLLEIHRITEKPEIIFKALAADFGVQMCDNPFELVINAAERLQWTRDPFDRIIVAQASLRQSPLVTKDECMHAHYKHCCW